MSKPVMICPKCNIEMVLGKAIKTDQDLGPRFYPPPCSFQAATVPRLPSFITAETLELIDCLKCPKCGHSDKIGTLN